MHTQIFHLHALSALHVGVGQAVGVVDLPIARAKATNLPLVPGSALKGVLRDEFAGDDAGQETLFGPDKVRDGDSAFAGALAFGDAHLLLLPVRSLAGICAFVTCPFVLARYGEDLKRAGVEDVPGMPKLADQAVSLCRQSALMAKDDLVVLEDLDLSPATGEDGEAWGELIAGRVHADATWRQALKERFAIVSDDNFSFLADTATEIRTRIKINNRGVAEAGALWYEENLPAETVLWGVLGADPARNGAGQDGMETMSAFRRGIDAGRTIQIGGKATVGRGLVRFIL